MNPYTLNFTRPTRSGLQVMNQTGVRAQRAHNLLTPNTNRGTGYEPQAQTGAPAQRAVPGLLAEQHHPPT